MEKKDDVLNESKFVFAASLTCFPISFQMTLGFVAIISSWNVLVFTWTAVIPAIQLISGPLFILIFYTIWKTVFFTAKRQENIRSCYYGLKGLIIINGVLFVSSIVLVVVTIFRPLVESLRELIRNYPHSIDKKQLMDDIQIRFSCCGANDVTNWFYNDWQNADIEPGHVVDLSSAGWDAVPYSCCSKESSPPCLHEGLKGFGLGSINSSGCETLLTYGTAIYLIICAFVSLLAIFPLVWQVRILKRLLQKEKDHEESKKKVPPKTEPTVQSEPEQPLRIHERISPRKSKVLPRLTRGLGGGERRKGNKARQQKQKKDIMATSSNTSSQNESEPNIPWNRPRIESNPLYLQKPPFSPSGSGDFWKNKRQTLSETDMNIKQGDVSHTESHLMPPKFHMSIH